MFMDQVSASVSYALGHQPLNVSEALNGLNRLIEGDHSFSRFLEAVKAGREQFQSARTTDLSTNLVEEALKVLTKREKVKSDLKVWRDGSVRGGGRQPVTTITDFRRNKIPVYAEDVLPKDPEGLSAADPTMEQATARVQALLASSIRETEWQGPTGLPQSQAEWVIRLCQRHGWEAPDTSDCWESYGWVQERISELAQASNSLLAHLSKLQRASREQFLSEWPAMRRDLAALSSYRLPKLPVEPAKAYVVAQAIRRLEAACFTLGTLSNQLTQLRELCESKLHRGTPKSQVEYIGQDGGTLFALGVYHA